MIKSTILFKQGDVILIPFPFTDFSTLKQRPALVISSDSFNARHQDIIAAAVTSHVPKQTVPSDYVLSGSDLKSAGLPRAFRGGSGVGDDALSDRQT